MKNDLTVFKNEQFGQVRTVNEKGKVFFAGGISQDGGVVRVIKRKYKTSKIVYILRFKRYGLNIEVEDEDLSEAKRKFTEKTFETSHSDSDTLVDYIKTAA